MQNSTLWFFEEVYQYLDTKNTLNGLRINKGLSSTLISNSQLWKQLNKNEGFPPIPKDKLPYSEFCRRMKLKSTLKKLFSKHPQLIGDPEYDEDDKYFNLPSISKMRKQLQDPENTWISHL